MPLILFPGTDQYTGNHSLRVCTTITQSRPFLHLLAAQFRHRVLQSAAPILTAGT